MKFWWSQSITQDSGLPLWPVVRDCLVKYCLDPLIVQPIQYLSLKFAVNTRFAVNTLQLQGSMEDCFIPIYLFEKARSIPRISLNGLQDLDNLRNIAEDRAQ